LEGKRRYTSIWVPEETKRKLEVLRVHPRQPLWEVIERLLGSSSGGR